MRTIYFVRHAQRDITVTDEQTAPLTQAGLKAAEELPAFFAEKHIKAIYASPFKRAADTIKPTAEHLGLPITVKTDLRERCVGTWVSDFTDFTRKQWAEPTYRMKNGESLNQVKERIMTVCHDIINESSGNLIICGHGTAFSVLFHTLTASFTYADFRKMTMPDIYRVSIAENGNWYDFERCMGGK